MSKAAIFERLRRSLIAAMLVNSVSGGCLPAFALELQSDNAAFGKGPYWALNNVWNKGELKNGDDYQQNILIDESRFPENTTMSWAWPKGTKEQIYAYPEIIFGSSFNPGPSDQSRPLPTRVANFVNLTATYSVKIYGETANYNLAFDLWLTTQPNVNLSTVKLELMVWIHSGRLNPGANFTYVLEKSDLNAKIYVKHNSGISTARGAPRWTYVACVTDTDLLSGSISISDIIKSLIWNGVLSGDEYLSGIEFGPEISKGSGYLEIKRLNYVWRSRSTLVSSPPSDILILSNSGGNHVVGTNGTGTIIYSDLFSSFQLKRIASKILLVKNGDISTLNVLEGVTAIRFLDGSYNVSSNSFTKAVP